MNDTNEGDNSMVVLKSHGQKNVTIFQHLDQYPITKSINVDDREDKGKQIEYRKIRIKKQKMLSPIDKSKQNLDNLNQTYLNRGMDSEAPFSPEKTVKPKNSNRNREKNNYKQKVTDTISSKKVSSSLSNSRVKDLEYLATIDQLKVSGLSNINSSSVASTQSINPKEIYLHYHVNSGGNRIGQKNMEKIIDLIHKNLICTVKDLIKIEGIGNIFQENYTEQYIINPIKQYQGNQNVSINYLSQTTLIAICKELHSLVRQNAIAWTFLTLVWIGVFASINVLRQDQFDQTDGKRVQRQQQNLELKISKESNKPFNYMPAFFWIHFSLWVFFWLLHTLAIFKSGVQMLETVKCSFLFLLLYIISEFAIGLVLLISREQNQPAGYISHSCILIGMSAFWIYSNFTFQKEIINIRQISVITQQKDIDTLY